MKLSAKCEHGERTVEDDTGLPIQGLLQEMLLACPRCAFDAEGFLPRSPIGDFGPVDIGRARQAVFRAPVQVTPPDTDGTTVYFPQNTWAELRVALGWLS